jgi:phage-related protein
MESTGFVYKGVNSSDMGVIRISESNGLFEELFVASKTVKQEKVRGRDEPYHLGVERYVLSFSISLWFEQGLTEERVDEIARWLDQDYYAEIYFNENPTRVFYAMSQGDSTLIHNGIAEGYVKLNFITKSPYSQSPVYADDFDLSLNTVDGMDITFVNKGDINCTPMLYIEKIGNGDISIINNSDGGRDFKLAGLLDLEKVTVDNKNEEISTDLIGQYRYGSHNNVFLKFPRGVNNLKVYGKCKLQFKYQFSRRGLY